jgi:hypothetical protein
MSISPRATDVRFDEDRMWVELEDGRAVAVPLAWYPRLLNALPERRAKVTISATGLHWEELDEDLSVEGMLHGTPAPGWKT